MNRQEKNRALHGALFARGPFTRHGLVVQAASKPCWATGDYTTSDRPVSDFVPDIVEHYRRWVEFSEAADDDAVPFANLSTGTHLYAVCFGAKPHFYPDNNPYAEPLVAHAAEADRLAEPKLENCRPLMRVFELAAALRRELGPDVTLGPPDMQTGFDTMCILWDKTDLLYAMIDQPEVVKRLAGKCARLLRNFIAAYRREFPNTTFGHCPYTWTPQEYGPWVSNDECGIMSPAMFEEFCLPELVELARQFGSLGMHCCANAQHQFTQFRRIPDFYAFNRVPTGVGWEGDNALEVLGGPKWPAMVPGWVSLDDMATLLRKAPLGTRFLFNSSPMDSVESAKSWMDGARRLIDKNQHKPHHFP